jgi:hypothetical protein
VSAPPQEDALAYRWWSQGAADEAKARDTALGAGALELRCLLESLDSLHGGTNTAEQLAGVIARIYCPGMLKRKYR